MFAVRSGEDSGYGCPCASIAQGFSCNPRRPQGDPWRTSEGRGGPPSYGTSIIQVGRGVRSDACALPPDVGPSVRGSTVCTRKSRSQAKGVPDPGVVPFLLLFGAGLRLSEINCVSPPTLVTQTRVAPSLRRPAQPVVAVHLSGGACLCFVDDGSGLPAPSWRHPPPEFRPLQGACPPFDVPHKSDGLELEWGGGMRCREKAIQFQASLFV